MADNSVAVCTDVLYQLLEKEWQALLQLTYLIDNVHKPIFDATQAASHHVAATTTTTNSKAAAAAIFPSTSSSSSSIVRSAFANATALLHTAVPQPITAAEPAGHGPLLSYTHYWALFANLPTLYESHAQLVRQLSHALHHLKGHHRRKRRTSPPPQQPLSNETKADLCSDEGNELLSWTSSALSTPREPRRTQAGATHNDGMASRAVSPSSLLSSPVSTTSEPDKSLTPVLKLFCGEVMQRYVAEHMMYTVQYTKSIAPRVLQLARLWRWSGGGAHGALGRLLPADEQLLRQHSGLLSFLHRSFGPSGRPHDGRLSQTTLPESSSNTVTDNAVMAAVEVVHPTRSHSPALGVNTPALHQGMTGFTQNTKSSDAHANAMCETNKGVVQMPVDWAGFQTLLLLLATPLPTLRRCVHAARVLIESGVLSAREEATLQRDFVDVAALNMSEVSTTVMEILAQHDVGALLDLVDDTATLTARNSNAGHNNNNKAQQTATVGLSCTKSAAIADKSHPTPAVTSTPTLLQRLRSGDYGRQLVHYGRLQKRVRRGRHERLVFLFSDCLCHVEELSNGRFRLCGSATLDVVRVRSMGDAPAMGILNCFEVLLPGAGNVLTFFADTPEQKRQWVDAIHYAVRRYTRQAATGKPHTSDVTSQSPSPSPAALPQHTDIAAGQSTMANANSNMSRMPPISAQSRLRRQGRYDAQLQQLLTSAEGLKSHMSTELSAQGQAPQPAAAAVAVAVAEKTSTTTAAQRRTSSAAESEQDSAQARRRTMAPTMLSAQSLSRNSSFATMRAFTTPHVGERSAELVNVLPTGPTTGASTPMLHSVSLHASVHRRVGSATLPLRTGTQGGNLSNVSSAPRSPVQGTMVAATSGGEHDVHEAATSSEQERLFEPVIASATVAQPQSDILARSMSAEVSHERLPPLPHENSTEHAASSTPHWRTASGGGWGGGASSGNITAGQGLTLHPCASPGPGGSMHELTYTAGAVARTNSNVSRRASYSTPLRRPVSERFESAQALKASAPRPQRSRPESRPRGRRERESSKAPASGEGANSLTIMPPDNVTATSMESAFPLLSQLSTPERAELTLSRHTRNATQGTNDDNMDNGSDTASEAPERTSSAEGSLMTVPSVFSSSEAGSALSLREERLHNDEEEEEKHEEGGNEADNAERKQGTATAAGQVAAATTAQESAAAATHAKDEQSSSEDDNVDDEDDSTVAAITGFHSSPREFLPTRPVLVASTTQSSPPATPPPSRHVDPTSDVLHAMETQPTVASAEGNVEDEESSSGDVNGSLNTEGSKVMSPTTKPTTPNGKVDNEQAATTMASNVTFATQPTS